MQSCVVCKSDIKADALVCIHCNSHQARWRRALDFSNTTLALLIALISVASVAVPVVARQFEPPPQDRVIARVVGSSPDDGSVSALVSNLGNRAAAFRAARIVLSGEDVVARGLARIPLSSSVPVLLQPGESEMLELQSEGNELPRFARPGEVGSEFVLVVEIVRFDGSVESIELNFRGVFSSP
jgi:hypothetical protein